MFWFKRETDWSNLTMFVLLTTALTQVRTIISTEGALRLPTTYDNHPICLSHPVLQIALNELNRPKIDLNQPSMTSNDYKWLPMTTNDYQRLSKTLKDYQRLSKTIKKTIWWPSYDYPMTIRWLSDDYPMTIRWLSKDDCSSPVLHSSLDDLVMILIVMVYI